MIFPKGKEYDSVCRVSSDAKYRSLIADRFPSGTTGCNLAFFFSILGPTNSNKILTKSICCYAKISKKPEHFRSSFKSGKSV